MRDYTERERSVNADRYGVDYNELAKQTNLTPEIAASRFAIGIKTEIENNNVDNAGAIVLQNLQADPDYYNRSRRKNETELAQGGAVAGPQTAAAESNALPDEEANADLKLIKEYPRLTRVQARNIYDQTLEILKTDAALTPETRKVLEQYEGRGGQTDVGVVDESLVHQFYTPYVVCKKMFDLAAHYGFAGGNVLEPSCGTGRFFKFAPAGSKLFGFDLEKTNIDIVRKLYPGIEVYQQAFETAFLQPPNFSKSIKKSWLPEMDLVIGNPPYGDYQGYYKSYMPKQYRRFEFLFIRLGLQLLRPGGLLVFIISQNFMNNGGLYDIMKKDILEIGQFVDAIRLPNGIFTATNVGTDIVIFRRK